MVPQGKEGSSGFGRSNQFSSRGKRGGGSRNGRGAPPGLICVMLRKGRAEETRADAGVKGSQEGKKCFIVFPPIFQWWQDKESKQGKVPLVER